MPGGGDARRGPQNANPRRSGPPEARRTSPRREHATVVHPWLSLPDRLASTQAAMLELAGESAFQCPLSEEIAAPVSRVPREKREGGVSIIVRKRRVPIFSAASEVAAG